MDGSPMKFDASREDWAAKGWSPEPSVPRPRVAYVMSRFPKITETFILFEILELERRGIDVEIFPLLLERADVVHPEAQRLMPRVRFAPFLSRAVLAANARMFRRAPRRYLAALAEAVWGTRRSLNFLAGAIGIFPKTVLMAQEMERLKISHLHAHFANHPALAALIVHRLTGLTFSFTAHGSDIHVDQTMFDRKLAAASFAVTVCRYNVEFLAERFGQWVRDRLIVLHCGTDPEVFSPSAETEKGAGSSLSILCVGALREVKGHRFLIEACRILADRAIAFDCRLIGEGPLRGELARHIRSAGLEGKVRLLGPMPRLAVRDAMREADVIVLPSILGSRGDREGIPVVLMEAMACARPVVSSRQSGIPELVSDGVSGMLCPPADAGALADALTTLALNPDLRSRMGLAGRSIVLRRFDLRRNASRKAALLSNVSKRSGPPREKEAGR